MREGRIEGRGDSPLSEAGREQAERVAAFIASQDIGPADADRQPAGPRQRHSPRRSPPACGWTPSLDHRIREGDLGWMEDLSYADVGKHMAEKQLRVFDSDAHGGEEPGRHRRALLGGSQRGAGGHRGAGDRRDAWLRHPRPGGASLRPSAWHGPDRQRRRHRGLDRGRYRDSAPDAPSAGLTGSGATGPSSQTTRPSPASRTGHDRRQRVIRWAHISFRPRLGY